MRHKQVERCCVGGLAFYLAMRFHMTREFEDFDVEDWLDNSKWFDVKLLVDATKSGTDFCKAMSNDVYSKAIKSVLGELGIASNHWVHLGRVTGPKILEMLEVEAEDIRILGNWNPTIQEQCYSTKLPMKPIRGIAGFSEASGMHYNVRTTVESDVSLLQATPFSYFIVALDDLDRVVNTSYTALCFLRLMKEMAQIFLQDAAVMMIEHPGRRSHPLYSLPVFEHPLWEVSCWLSCGFCLLLPER
jgi:hypothetical protein